MNTRQPYFGVFRIATPTPLLNVTQRAHFRVLKKIQLQMAWELRLAAGNRIPPAPLERARVTIDRHSVGTPDQDGLVGGAKQLIDALLVPRTLPKQKGGGHVVRHSYGLSFLVDDGPEHIELVCKATRVRKRELQCTIITIEELTPWLLRKKRGPDDGIDPDFGVLPD